MNLDFIQGQGRDKSGQWPSEKSVLVFNISKDTASMLGKRYNQNAILWIEKDARAQLLWLDAK